MVLKNTLIDYWRQVHKKWNYVEISTPQIMNRGLCGRPPATGITTRTICIPPSLTARTYAIKPMNCPGSMLVYASWNPTPTETCPCGIGELGLVHRHELSGALHGMFRVRCFTQDDAHIFMTPRTRSRMRSTASSACSTRFTPLFGLPYQIELSTMPEDHIGTRGGLGARQRTPWQDAITEHGQGVCR